jgi:Zn-dependent M28 family amino/carboxypeptidase
VKPFLTIGVLASLLWADAPCAAATAAPAEIKAHVEFLADDLLEGREPGTRGYDLAARYVAIQFARAGLRPGGDAGTFQQRVPLRSTLLVPEASAFELVVAGSVERYRLGEDFVVPPSRQVEHSEVTADVVYAGHGVVAPHLGIDDYARLDVNGKLVVVLAGTPRFLLGDEAAHFASPRLKQELAAERGAIGVITLQTPINEMQLPFAQILRSLQFRTFAWLDAAGVPRGGGTAVPHLATLSVAGAGKFLARAGVSLADLTARANQKLPPSAVEIAAKVRIARKSRLQDLSSANVVGVIEGGDATLRHETVVMTAHLDHLGMAPTTSGDRIYNGALDNATGVAVIAEAARLISALPSRPKRSIVFVALTGEEAGLMGSEFFVHHAHAAGRTLVANLNIDMPILTYDFHDICAFGAEHSSIGDLIAQVAQARGVPLSPDPRPQRRRFTRSDQYSFVKAGIPAAFLNTGVHSTTEEGAGQRAREEIEMKHYHRVSDDTSLPIHYDAAARFASLGAAILVELANAPQRPHWKAGNFFGETFGKASETRSGSR